MLCLDVQTYLSGCYNIVDFFLFSIGQELKEESMNVGLT